MRYAVKRILADWSPTVPGLFLYYWGHHTICPKLHAKPKVQLNQTRFTNEGLRKEWLLTTDPALFRFKTLFQNFPER
jgi:hypothetical protein